MGKESELEWPIIKHIVIDGHYIQMEGRYVKGGGYQGILEHFQRTYMKGI